MDIVWAPKYSKARVSVRVRLRVRVSFSRCENIKCPLSTNQMVSKVRKVMKKVFLDKVWATKCGKVAFLLKLGLALGLRLAFHGVKMSTLYDPDGAQGWESDEKSVF